MKLADFGVAKPFTSDKPEIHSTNGTLKYTAPEVIKVEPFSPIIDEWAVGVVAYEMLCGFYPFPSGRILTPSIEEMAKLELEIVCMKISFDFPEWKSVSNEAKDFIKKLMCKQTERLTATNALHSAWTKRGKTKAQFITSGSSAVPPSGSIRSVTMGSNVKADTTNPSTTSKRRESLISSLLRYLKK